MHCLGLHLENFKGDFLNILTFLHPQILDFQIVESRPNIVLFIYFIFYLFSFQMYKSQFQKIDPYDWFCGAGSHINMISEGSCDIDGKAEFSASLLQSSMLHFKIY